MSLLRISLLGGLRLSQAGGGPVSLTSKKARAMLAFLACSGEAQSRDKLAALLWEDSDEVQARANLRQALAAVRRALGEAEHCLQADGDSVSLAPGTVELDVDGFRDELSVGGPTGLTRAVELYRGDLLDGFHVRAPNFEDWLRNERQRLRAQAVEALETLLAWHETNQDDDGAIFACNRLLGLDPLRENVHRSLMRLYAKRGDQAQALKQYRRCKSVLQRELGVAPAAETHQLYNTIQHQRRQAPAPAPDAGPEAMADPAPVKPGSETELRQSTILFADLCDYTGLSQRLDLEALHELVNGFYAMADEVIVQFGGTVDKHIGDNVMAVFGVPVAHGNDPERAVRAAMAIRDGMAKLPNPDTTPLQVHIGIATGQVLAGGIGRRERSVTGEPVNLAARLTDLAAHGDILVSEEVRNALPVLLDTEHRGQETVKGFAQPVSVWSVTGLVKPMALPERREIVGRRIERSQFQGALAATRDADQGLVALLRGDAGIGKTRLADEFRRVAEDEGFAALRAQILDFGNDRASDVLPALVRDISDGGMAPDGGNDDETASQQVFLTDLLGEPQTETGSAMLGAMSAERRRQGRHQVLKRILAEAADKKPLFLLVEDVHWATAALLEDLSVIAEASVDHPLVLVLTTREGGDPIDRQWRSRLSGGTLLTFDLGPLRRLEAEAMAERFGLADEDQVAACIERAGGNPLFLEQLLLGARNRGAGEVPGSVQSLVLARMDNLDPHDRLALQAAAVIGQNFAAAALRFLLGDGGYQVDGLAAHGFVDGSDASGYQFAHALVRDAVRQSLLPSRARELHRRAAQWYGERDLALTAEHLDLAADDGASSAYLAAARQAAGLYHAEEALRLASRGLEASDPSEAHAGLALLKGEILTDIGKVDDALAAFAMAEDAAACETDRADALIGRARGLAMLDRFTEALEALDTARVEIDGIKADRQRSLIHYLLGNIHFPMGRIDTCLQEQQVALEHARRARSPELEARALSGLGDAEYARGRIDTAFGYYDRCVAVARKHRLSRIEAINLVMRADCRSFLLDLDGALEDCAHASKMIADIGDPRARILCCNIEALALCHTGDADQALARADEALALAQSIGSRRFIADNEGMAAMVLVSTGNWPEAVRRADLSLAASGGDAETYTAPVAHAVIALASDDPERRAAALAAGEELLAQGSLSHCHFHFGQLAMESCLRHGNLADLEHFARALETYTAAESVPWVDYALARARALAAADRGDADPRVLTDLIARGESAKMRIALSALSQRLDRGG